MTTQPKHSRQLNFVQSTFDQVVPLNNRYDDEGTAFMFRNFTSMSDVADLFVTGNCLRTRRASNQVVGVAWCEWVYSIGNEASFVASGLAMDGGGGLFAIQGGSGLLSGIRGELRLEPLFKTADGPQDFFLNTDFYAGSATFQLN